MDPLGAECSVYIPIHPAYVEGKLKSMPYQLRSSTRSSPGTLQDRPIHDHAYRLRMASGLRGAGGPHPNGVLIHTGNLKSIRSTDNRLFDLHAFANTASRECWHCFRTRQTWSVAAIRPASAQCERGSRRFSPAPAASFVSCFIVDPSHQADDGAGDREWAQVGWPLMMNRQKFAQDLGYIDVPDEHDSSAQSDLPPRKSAS